MIPAFVLAIFLTLTPQAQPQIVAPFETESSCREAAGQANRMDAIRTPEAKAAGALFVCLQIVAD